MSIEQIVSDLHAHEGRSQHRFEELRSAIKEHKMSEPTHIKNIFEPAAANPMASVLPYMGGWGGAGAGAGAGLGAGLLGGILGGVLLNRNGLLGNGGGEGCVTPTQLTSGLASVIDSNQNTVLLQSVGDVKAAVPLAEAQVQLAIAGATAETNRAIGQTENLIVSGQAVTNKAISDAIATSLASQSAIKETVLTSAAANLTATQNAAYTVTQAVRDDGDKTRALIIAQNEANLQRQLAVAEATLAEERAVGRARANEVNITQTVNQNQAQAQVQLQQQQQAILLSNIWERLNGLQNAVATNSNLIVGNTGATTTGAQTANPVNVRT